MACHPSTCPFPGAGKHAQGDMPGNYPDQIPLSKVKEIFKDFKTATDATGSTWAEIET